MLSSNHVLKCLSKIQILLVFQSSIYSAFFAVMVRQNPRCKEYCLKVTYIATPGSSRKCCGIASLKIFPNMNALQLNVIAPCACGIRIVTLCNRPSETRPSGFLPFTHRKFSPPRGQLVKFLILVGQFVASSEDTTFTYAAYIIYFVHV